MYQNGQDEKWCVFLASNLLRVSPMRLTTHYHHTRYEENGSEGKFSLRMPRRKSSIFKPPVLIQFQVTADTPIRGVLEGAMHHGLRVTHRCRKGRHQQSRGDQAGHDHQL